MEGAPVASELAQMRGKIAVVRVRGYLDHNTADVLDELIDAHLETGCYAIIFDLGGVKYIGSRGWSVFLRKIKQVRDRGGDLKLACMNEDVYEVFKVLEFFWFLRSYDTLEEAVLAFEYDTPPMP